MNTLTRAELLKFNLLEMVKDHRAKETADCNVSLGLIRELAELAGLTFTDNEQGLFI